MLNVVNDIRWIYYFYCRFELIVVVKIRYEGRLRIEGKFVGNGVIGMKEIVVNAC